MSLHPWAKGPFELLAHADGHLRGGEDFDRRIALISFDNAIEVTITTYLTLHPIQRGDRTYPSADVDKWLANYHTKLDFLGIELSKRSLKWEVEKSHIVYAHEHRNEQYHGGNKGTPEKEVLAIIRRAAVWIFSTLFEVADVETLLEQDCLDKRPPSQPQPDDAFDRAIDLEFEMVEVAGKVLYASEVLFAVDYGEYRETGARLCEGISEEDMMENDG